MKRCSKCKIEKELSEFYKDKKSKDNYRSSCKSCTKELNKKYYQDNAEQYRKKHYQDNAERIKEYHKKYYQDNLERIKERNKKYKKANAEYYKEINKKYYQDNKEHYKEYMKKWYQDNKEHIKQYQKVNAERIKEYDNQYRKQRKQTDPLYKLKCNLRSRTSDAFKNKGYSKTSKTQEMLGVDWEVAKAHIERQFTKGMNWDNQGEWHIDHDIPLASANTKEELMKLCHYSNLKPMWAEDNLIKKDSINGQQVKFRL